MDIGECCVCVCVRVCLGHLQLSFGHFNGMDCLCMHAFGRIGGNCSGPEDM